MSDPSPIRRTWFHDALSPDLGMVHRVEEYLYAGRSAYQGIEVIRTRSFGACLVLDGKIQSSEADEFIYHESLVHAAMITHPEPRTVLIAGGGEGATLREVVRHRTVEHATMVDLDEQVVDVCRQYLPAFSDGAFEDPRAELIVGDFRRFVEESPRTFDVIIIDLPDPLEVGPAQMLYTREFYSAVKGRLAPGGIISVQSESSRWCDLQAFVAIVRTISDVFAHAAPYQAHIPSFSSLWGFTTASDSLQANGLTPAEVDRRVARRVAGTLRSYDGRTHAGAFSLPKHIRTALETPGAIITDASPLAVY
jgi:spermidine synthase